MSIDVRQELAVLQRMSLPELQARYAELFGEPTRSRHKHSLVRRMLWRMQARAEGDLSERVRRRAAALADDADLRLYPPKKASPSPAVPSSDPRLPAPGTVLTRLYKGRLLQVTVLADGFAYEGQRYPSLSAVAKQVTGSHLNGYQFFALTGNERKKA
ncbi:MAG: DUF2924 domain-containing protein [Planctomycetes bacterium]|nr:DUF2924 domain-containing protein [Planctomycetota bacterium]